MKSPTVCSLLKKRKDAVGRRCLKDPELEKTGAALNEDLVK